MHRIIIILTTLSTFFDSVRWIHLAFVKMQPGGHIWPHGHKSTGRAKITPSFWSPLYPRLICCWVRVQRSQCDITMSSTTSPISLIRQCVYSYRCISHKRLSIADLLACAVLAGHSVEQLNGLIRRIIECTTVTVLLDTTDLTQVRRVDICIRYSAHANTYVFRCPMPLPQDHTTFTKIRDLWTGKK